MSPDGKFVEMVEYADHPWFVACQFHPEYKSRPLDPHPLFRDFVAAAYEYRRTAIERWAAAPPASIENDAYAASPQIADGLSRSATAVPCC